MNTSEPDCARLLQIGPNQSQPDSAEYLDAHRFGFDEVEHIVDAFYTAINVHEFTSLAAGCGMAVVELEWFWALS